MLPAPPHRLCSHLTNTSRAALAATSLPYSNASLGIASALLRHGLISNVSLGSPVHPNPAQFPSLPKAAQRVWVTLKHRNGQPVLRRVELVSKSSLRKIVDNKELGLLLRGKRSRNVAGVGSGEIFVVKVPTDTKIGRKGVQTYLEGWEAFRRGLGGEVVCRAS